MRACTLRCRAAGARRREPSVTRSAPRSPARKGSSAVHPGTRHLRGRAATGAPDDFFLGVRDLAVPVERRAATLPRKSSGAGATKRRTKAAYVPASHGAAASPPSAIYGASASAPRDEGFELRARASLSRICARRVLHRARRDRLERPADAAVERELAQRIASIATPALLGESSTVRRSSRFIGTSPKPRLSMRMKQTLLSFCHGDVVGRADVDVRRRRARTSSCVCTASVLEMLLRAQRGCGRAC